ncbi:helix-turn-helix domain-containing protein [Paracoccus beibuensis]|uniref:helix-turn-helix domain-containing protein n=1 Tax=Paracoccus beibuensis TaxID=547602 RepID=UPI0022402DEA|nr:helix-turn-helix domain-containing protein [Paracoccus beibuensis]
MITDLVWHLRRVLHVNADMDRPVCAIPAAFISDSREFPRPENLDLGHQGLGALLAVENTRTDMSASELRATAARRRGAKAARLAIAVVLDGTDRRTAAEVCGMDRRTLRDWVHRHSAEGIADLSNRYWWDAAPEH